MKDVNSLSKTFFQFQFHLELFKEKFIIKLYLHFFIYKNKLYKNNEAEIGQKNKNKLTTFWGWKMWRQKKIDELYFFKTCYKRMTWMPSKSSIVRYSNVLSGYATLHSLRTVLKLMKLIQCPLCIMSRCIKIRGICLLPGLKKTSN